MPASHVALHGLRLLCALAVMTAHWSDAFYNRLIPQAQFAVDILFAAEGWLAADLLARRRHLSSCARLMLFRLREVYPTYLVALLLGAVAVRLPGAADMTAIPDAGFVRALACGLLLQPTLQHWTAAGAVFPLNWPSWAVVLELWAFAGLCLILRAMTLPLLLLIIGVGAVGIIIAAILWQDVNVGWRTEHYGFGVFRIAFDFFVGVLLHRVRGRELPRIPPQIIWGSVSLLFMLRLRHVALPLLLVGTPTIVAGAGSIKQARSTAAIGRFAEREALSIYLLHFPVLSVLRVAAARIAMRQQVASGFWSYVLALICVVGVSVTIRRLAASLTAKPEPGIRRRSRG